MSYQAINAVLKFSQSKGRARLLLLCIAHHAGPDGKGAYPSTETLSAETHIGRRDLQRLTRQVQALGELDVKTGGGLKANHYTILLPIPAGSGATSGLLPAGPNAASGAAYSPPQQPLVVGSVDFLNKNNNIGRAQLLAELRRENVAEGVAVDLVTQFPARIIEQLAYLSDRKPRDRAATLVDSIKGNWKPPAAYLKRIEEENREAERAKRTKAEQESAAREEEERAAKREREAQDAARREERGAQLDATFEALGAEEKGALDAQVEAQLDVLPAFMRTETARKMMRRELLKNQ